MRLVENVEQVLTLLDQVGDKSLKFQQAHAIKNYSDLLLASNTKYRAE